uniref:hypothetical protein n=1 Tax=Alistipes shahii TaxID=328814 RepID=UPI00307E3EF4
CNQRRADKDRLSAGCPLIHKILTLNCCRFLPMYVCGCAAGILWKISINAYPCGIKNGYF